MADSTFPKLNGPTGIIVALLLGGGVGSGTSILARDDSALEARLAERAKANEARFAEKSEMSALHATLVAAESRDEQALDRLIAIEARLL